MGASWTEPAVLREQVRCIGRVTDRPFCVNLVLDFEQDERLDVVVEERVPIVSFSFGLRPDLVARARAGGSRVFVQVGSADAARAAVDAGADALIVQGVEAGGHVQSVVGLLPLLAEVRRAVSLPLLAAGGIGDPASARAALAAGAVAVVMGTRFVASDESAAHERYKTRLVKAEARDTVLTETPRPAGRRAVQCQAEMIIWLRSPTTSQPATWGTTVLMPHDGECPIDRPAAVSTTLLHLRSSGRARANAVNAATTKLGAVPGTAPTTLERIPHPWK